MPDDQKEKYEQLTIESIENIVVMVIGLLENETDIQWLKDNAGGNLFSTVNSALAKEVFSSNRITFQSGVAVADPKNSSSMDEIVKALINNVDPNKDLGIILQSGDVTISIPSKQMIPLSAIITISFHSKERPRPIILKKLSPNNPITPGQMIKVG